MIKTTEQNKKKWSVFQITVCVLLAVLIAGGAGFAVFLNNKVNRLGAARGTAVEAEAGESADAGGQGSAAAQPYNNSADITAVTISADMANKVEELTGGLKTDQEKCIAIAEWICANISNREGELKRFEKLDNVYTWYAERAGLCGVRSVIMAEMLKILNIPAKVFNMYDFPDPYSGHTCVQVWYDGAWHFYDPTYGGYFLDGNKVLSFEEIVADPQKALDGMVVFKKTKDVTGSYGFDENNEPTMTPLGDNDARMHATYTPESLAGYTSYAFVDGVDVTTIYPEADLSDGNLPIGLGDLDGSDRDVLTEGGQTGISQYICYALADAYLIKSDWQFKNCIPGQKYFIKYYIYNAKDSGTHLTAVPAGAEINKGGELTLAADVTEWVIEFTPEGNECGLLIDFDAQTTGEGAWIDRIEIGKA